jgi:transcriptional regulator with XRE-family HTH domain
MDIAEKARKQLAINIRKYREAAGMTQKELAEKMGLVVSSISYWESGKSSPSAGQAYQLCDLFGVQPTVMFGVEAEFDDLTAKALAFYTQYMAAPKDIRLAVDSLIKRK